MFIVPCNGMFEIRERLYDVAPNGKMIRLEQAICSCETFAIAKAKLLYFNSLAKKGRATA